MLLESNIIRSSMQASRQFALEEMESEEKITKAMFGGEVTDHLGDDVASIEEHKVTTLEEQMAFWNWTRISEATKEREEAGCGGRGGG